MAYSLQKRFRQDDVPYPLFEPGMYQQEIQYHIKPNKVSFNASGERKTTVSGTLWTHSIYSPKYPSDVINCSSFKLKTPRFPYGEFSAKDLEKWLCQCGIESPCDCLTSPEKPTEEICQGKAKKLLYIGLSPACKSKGIRKVKSTPPIYDPRLNEATAYYHGCKWSKWSSKRTSAGHENWPGPAHYNIRERPQNQNEECMEKFRFFRRKTSRQLRFIEAIQRQNLLQDMPGPGAYTPKYPNGTELNYLGPKAPRMAGNSAYDQCPGPADHDIVRSFDLPKYPSKVSNAPLPDPSIFGVKAPRFKPKLTVGPSPADYTVPPISKCKFGFCSNAAFGSSTERWKDENISDSDNEEDDSNEKICNVEEHRECAKLSWMFRSNSKRFKKIAGNVNATYASYSNIRKTRCPELQEKAPFSSSEGKFKNWYNWIPVLGNEETPGPGYYNGEKPKTISAVPQGSFNMSPRFPLRTGESPAPNAYDVGNGLEIILKTFNHRLQKNINQQNTRKFHWKAPKLPKNMSFKEREDILINNIIQLLSPIDVPLDTSESLTLVESTENLKRKRPKLLRCFVKTSG